MNEIAKKFRDTATFLNAEADAIDPPPSAPNLYRNPTSSFGPLPEGLVTAANPYGTRADIGSPGWQVMLRTYARTDGKADRNAYVKDSNLIPLWPDTDQEWEAKFS